VDFPSAPAAIPSSVSPLASAAVGGSICEVNTASTLQLILVGVLQIIVVLIVCWFGTRGKRTDFRIFRVVALTLLCLASSLPFAVIAYLLWDRGWDSQGVRIAVALAALTPLITAFTLGYLKLPQRRGK
jgi:cytochrome bd-type quinol oxidase subunit 2